MRVIRHPENPKTQSFAIGHLQHLKIGALCSIFHHRVDEHDWIDTELAEKALVIRFLESHRSKSVFRKAQQVGTGIRHQ
jgi:hypothetical protein